MQAVTRVNTEQAPKRVMRKPTRLRFGEGRRRWGSERHPPSGSAGVMAMACMQGKQAQHGKPRTVGPRESQPATREGQAGPDGVAERPVVPMKPGNAGGGKGPWFKKTLEAARAGRLA